MRQPAETAFAPAQHLSLIIAGGGAACAGRFALLGWCAVGRISAPLLELAVAAERLPDAGGVALPAARGFREIAVLTGSLCALLERLGERDCAPAAANAELEARVIEHTRELASAHAFLRSILDATPDGVYVLLRDGTPEFINAADQRLWEADDAPGPGLAPLWAHWPPEARERFATRSPSRPSAGPRT